MALQWILILVLTLVLENGVMGLLCHCTLKSCAWMNNTCELPPNSDCFMSIQLSSDHSEEVVDYGCMPPEDSATLQCKAKLIPNHHTTPRGVECCHDYDLCNKDLDPTPTYITTTHSGVPPAALNLDGLVPSVVVISITLCIVIVIVIGACAYQRYKRAELLKEKDLEEAEQCIPAGESLRELLDSSSGSGSGLPLLVQRTIAKQISLVETVGKGRYGEVWLSKWRGENVAVKIFFTHEEASWFRETELYQTVLLRHDNILGFIAADIKGTGGWTQLFLITDYHELGSLYDYLLANMVDVAEALCLAHSAVCGLNHLHTEVIGTRGKPAIAHRDVKSKNILVKSNGQCCIADLGMAIKKTGDIFEQSGNLQQGTKRYMSPEILDHSISKHQFDAFTQSDMYSFGLVMWEIAQRCIVDGAAQEYNVPFQDSVSADPSFEEMRRVVCIENRRPPLSASWAKDEHLLGLTRLIVECWAPRPCARCTSLRVKKTLGALKTAACVDSTDKV